MRKFLKVVVINGLFLFGFLFLAGMVTFFLVLDLIRYFRCPSCPSYVLMDAVLRNFGFLLVAGIMVGTAVGLIQYFVKPRRTKGQEEV